MYDLGQITSVPLNSSIATASFQKSKPIELNNHLLKPPLCKLSIWDAWQLFTQPSLKTQGSAAHSQWQYLPCANHTVNWALCAQVEAVSQASLALASWRPDLKAREHHAGGLLLPFSMFEIHEAQIASGRMKKPDLEVIQKESLADPLQIPSLRIHWTLCDCLSRSTMGRGHEWGNQGSSAPETWSVCLILHLSSYTLRAHMDSF